MFGGLTLVPCSGSPSANATDRQNQARVSKLKLDLHPVHNRGSDIDRALREIIDEAVRTRAALVEIIPGKGSGQLKKRVLRFLEQDDVRALYHRVEKDADNFGRVFVHFRWSSGSRGGKRARRHH